MRFALILLAFLSLAFCLFEVLFEQVPALDIMDRSGCLIAKLPIRNGLFTHHYIHSIHKTPVDEEFRIEGDFLELYQVKYESYGVGMPTDAGDGFRLENGRFVLDMHREFKQIDIRVSFIPGHGIIYDGVFHPFTEWVPIEKTVRLQPDTAFIYRFRRMAHP